VHPPPGPAPAAAPVPPPRLLRAGPGRTRLRGRRQAESLGDRCVPRTVNYKRPKSREPHPPRSPFTQPERERNISQPVASSLGGGRILEPDRYPRTEDWIAMNAPPRARNGLTVGVIGAGRVGTVLAAALAAAGHTVTAVTPTRTPERLTALLPGVP